MCKTVTGHLAATMLKTTEHLGLASFARRLSPFVRQTPVQVVRASDFGLSCAPITLKLELLQYCGNAKMRAAAAFCQAIDADVSTIVSACAADEAMALAHVACQRGLRARLHVSTNTPFAQVARMRAAHAELIFDSRGGTHRRRSAQKWARRYGGVLYDPRRSQVARQGLATIGLELSGQLNDDQSEIDTLMVPVATGATMTGFAEWSQGRVKLVAVEPQRAAALYQSLRVGHLRRVEVSGLTVGGPGTRRLAPEIFRLAQQSLSDAVVVSDAAIVEAQYHLWSQLRLAADPTGVLGLAALTSEAYVPRSDERVGVIVPSAHLGPIDWEAAR